MQDISVISWFNTMAADGLVIQEARVLIQYTDVVLLVQEIP